MLISCRWLNELLEGATIVLDPVTDRRTQLSAASVAEILTNLGLEVDGLQFFDLPGVIVGELRSVEPHPQSDKLSLVRLFDGAQELQVVCGAQNLPGVGGKVAFAPVGTRLPGGLELTVREVRGVESRGMICSEEELDIGSDGDGILILPSDWAAGTLLSELVPGIVDALIEIAVTPNRPDALGHMGVAIDLAVALSKHLGKPVSTRTPKLAAVAETVARQDSLVTIPAGDRCGRYLGYALEGAQVSASPLWLRVRLHRVGLRPINDVVDITNYVLLETGQPLHAFDRAKLAEGRVVVRMAAAGEPMTTLDGREIALDVDDLVIADAGAPQALAGVMGGADSAVSEASTALLLEIAWFEPRGIRRSAKRHGYHTDASHRFERGVDDGGKLELAAKRALHLLQELCGARCVAWHEAVGQRPPAREIVLRPARIRGLLGMAIPDDEAARILEGLGVRVDRRRDPAAWRCTAPSFRPDLIREVDLIEEVMRHHGLDALPVAHSLPSEFAEPLAEDPRRRLADRLGDALRGLGLHEHLSLAFCAEEELDPAVFTEVPADRRVRVGNPLREQLAVMRSHMLPGLLAAAAFNHARHDRALGLYEIGRIYRWPAPGSQPLIGDGPTAAVDARLPQEPGRAAILRADRRGGEQPDRDGPQARAVVADLLRALEGVGVWAEARAGANVVAWLHPGVQIGLWVGAVQVGVAGELHPDLAVARELDSLEIGYGELWLDALPAAAVPQFAATPRFPSSARDLSLDLADAIAAAEVVAAIAQSVPESVGDRDDPVRLGWSGSAGAGAGAGAVQTLEDYRGKGVEAGRHALLLRLHYRADERSVTDAEVQALHDAIVSSACDLLRPRDPALRVR